MPNRFEMLVPDIVGAFDRGRAQTRQVDRERLADQEMRAQVDRSNQFRQLAGQAYAAPPAERQQFVAQAAQADPQAAMAMERHFGAQDKTQQELLMDRMAVTAGALVNAPEQMRPLLYKSMLPELKKFVPNSPDEYSPDMIPVAKQFLAARSGQAPAQLQYFDAMTASMTPEEREDARRVQMGLKARPSSAAIAYKIVKGADGRERLVAADPRTPGAIVIDDGGGAFVSQTPGETEAEKTRAQEQEKNAARQAELAQKNTRAFDVYTTGMRGLQRSLEGTETGPLAGRLPAVTSAQQTAEGAIANMAPVLKQMFRESGEGTFTEGDQQLLLNMLPKRTDHSEARAAKIEMIDQIVAAKLGIQAPVAPTTTAPAPQPRGPQPAPTRAPPPAAGAPVRVSSQQERDALPPGTQYVAPDGSLRTKQ